MLSSIMEISKINVVGWVAEVKSSGEGVKILPRVLFEGWSVDDYMKLFADDRMMREVAEFITQTIEVRLI